MAGPSLVVSVSANIAALQQDMAKAAASIKTIETTTTEASAAGKAWGSTLNSLGAQLAGMFTVGAIVGFGRTVLQAGDAIKKMADQTSLSYAEVQKLMYIAGQSGSSVQSLVGAVQNLQQRLGDDNSGAAGAMKRLGINADAFNKLSTYAQMTTLASAIKAIADPTEQASVAAAIFGKTWKEILPAIKSGMAETGEQAALMADQTVESLDRVGDAMKRAEQQATAWGGWTVLKIEEMGFALGDYLSRFDPAHFGQSNAELLKHEEQLARVANTLSGAFVPALQMGEAAKGMGMSFEDASKMAKAMDLEIAASIKVNTAAAAAVETHTAALTRQYPALDRLKDKAGDLTAKLDAMEAQLRAAGESNAIFDSGLKFTAETIETQVGPAIESMGEQVRLLSGELVSLARAQEMRAAGGTSEIGALSAKEFTAAGGKNRIAMLENTLSDRANYGPTYEGMLAYMADQVLLAALQQFLASMPHAASGIQDAPGGWSMVGERGPEAMYVPPHANIYPSGSGAGAGMVTNVYITQPLGTPSQIARAVDAAVTKSMRDHGYRG